MADNTVAVRIALQGATDIIRQLSKLGDDGQEALARLATKAAEVSGRLDIVAAGSDKVGAALRALSSGAASGFDVQIAGLAKLAAAQKNTADVMNGLPESGLTTGSQTAASLELVKAKAEEMGASVASALGQEGAAWAALLERVETLDPAHQRENALAQVRVQLAQVLSVGLNDEAQAAQVLEAALRALDPSYARVAVDAEKYLASINPAIGLQREQALVA